MNTTDRPKPKVALIVGAGISCEARLPSTKRVTAQFLTSLRDRDIPRNVQTEISRNLHKFWTDIFGYDRSKYRPSLEDHFTAIDLAANTGHHLGPLYSPSKLRAIRRLSIHRVFQILDARYKPSAAIGELLERLTSETELSIVSLNWDVVLENHLTASYRAYDYGLPVKPLLDSVAPPELGTRLYKLHGSTNWVYCDSCRTLFRGPRGGGKDALRLGAYLEARDFEVLESPVSLQNALRQLRNNGITCRICHSRMSGRVGTFSYRKDYAIQQLQTIWHDAFDALREASFWLFIGYSMPDADFEFKQILKSAELAQQANGSRKIHVVLKKDSNAAKRYRRFFGTKAASIAGRGLAAWMGEEFPTWLDQVAGSAPNGTS